MRHTSIVGVAICFALFSHGNVWATRPSPSANEALRAIRAMDNQRDSPFIVLDKKAARLWVFNQRARQIASTAVLLGAAVGDESAPGIGERPIAAIQPHERTTRRDVFAWSPGAT